MKKFVALSLVAVGLTVSGCATTGATSRTGYALISMHKEAGEVNGTGDGSKKGTACSQSILGLITSGDSSIEAAKAAGKITNVVSVDYQYTRYATFYGEVCTIVSGN